MVFHSKLVFLIKQLPGFQSDDMWFVIGPPDCGFSVWNDMSDVFTIGYFCTRGKPLYARALE